MEGKTKEMEKNDLFSYMDISEYCRVKDAAPVMVLIME